MDGGIRTWKEYLRAFFTGDVAGYRFYVTHQTPCTESEIKKLRRIPFLLPAFISNIIGKILIGRSVKLYRYHNIIPVVSRQQIGKALTGGITLVTEIKITHQELGTGTATPANSDTGLQTPVGTTRKNISSLAYSLNQINISSFWAAGEATGTWSEYAVFMNGTSTSNSGVIFNRVSIAVTVASTDALTLDGTVTIS
jgi:hypothetical protein